MTLLALSIVIASVIPFLFTARCCGGESVPGGEWFSTECCQQDQPAGEPEEDREDREGQNDRGPFDCDCSDSCCEHLLQPMAGPASDAVVVSDIGCGLLLMRAREFAPGLRPDDIDHPPIL